MSSEASNILSSKLSEEENYRLKIGEQSVDIKGVGLYTLENIENLTDSQKNYMKLFKIIFKKFFRPSRDIPC